VIQIEEFYPERVRNFSVIAHIDHGKSTLCDRLLEATGTVSKRVLCAQFLDKLQVERERGITVKAQSSSMIYSHNGEKYLLNLIDTPGHVDFNYEVSRSLAACQGALLLVDATQGVQAQTIANFYLAFSQNIVIIPVINKIDVTSAQPEEVAKEIETLFDFKREEMLFASGKTGIGIDGLLKEIIERIPAPKSDRAIPFKALLFDSWFDEYKGVILLVAVKDGLVKKGDLLFFHSTGQEYEVLEIGILFPDQKETGMLYAGQVGYIITGMKTVRDSHIGDTISFKKKSVIPFPGFKSPKPMVFAGIFPVDNNEFEPLKDAIEKLTLNDSSVTVEKTSSNALGLGFRCGFLGLLHMEVFQQRLEQEYHVAAIATAPNVLYKALLKNGKEVFIDNPINFPDPTQIEAVFEPMIKATILLQKEHIGPVIDLCQKKRGVQIEFNFIGDKRVMLIYSLPLNEVAVDFYDSLKSISSGYASLDYEEAGYQEGDLVKMDILINGKAVDALSIILHSENAQYIGRSLVESLKEEISKQMFEVVIQAAIGAKIIARSTISAFKKDVTAHCYGGDKTRKQKLLKKQIEGKKLMKRVGNVEIPQKAFLVILKHRKES